MKLSHIPLLALALSPLGANALSISCQHRETIPQKPHKSSDYITDYDIKGTIESNEAKLTIVGQEYYLALKDNAWVRGKKGNTYNDVDKRSTFKFAKQNGEYRVYTNDLRSDRTGAMITDIAFILKGELSSGENRIAIYSKATQTDDLPFREKISLSCAIK
jgi:hypothetical protein